MPFTAIHCRTNEIHDVTRKRYGDQGWRILWGKQLLGFALGEHKRSWMVFADDGSYCVYGIATIHDAYQYLLRVHGIWKSHDSHPTFHRLSNGVTFIEGLNKFPCKNQPAIPNIFFPSIDRWELDE